jgi:hypothetical protein
MFGSYRRDFHDLRHTYTRLPACAAPPNHNGGWPGWPNPDDLPVIKTVLLMVPSAYSDLLGRNCLHDLECRCWETCEVDF